MLVMEHGIHTSQLSSPPFAAAVAQEIAGPLQ